MSTPLGSIGLTGSYSPFEQTTVPAATPTAGKGEMPLVPLTGSAVSGTMAVPQQGSTVPGTTAQSPLTSAPRSTGAVAAATSTTGTTVNTTGTTSSGFTQTSATLASASGTDTFLQLLVAQMKNQDPTSPMDSQSFVTELAQFNTVEQMLNLNQTVNAENSSQQANEGIGMLGKNVTYAVTSVTGGTPTTSSGTVSGVGLSQGQVELQIGSQQVPLSEVTAVS